MGFQFATCNKNMAMLHLKKAYPKRDISEESLKEIMPFITADIVRIQDPDFHSPVQVVPGTNWTECPVKRKEIKAAFQKFHDSLIKE